MDTPAHRHERSLGWSDRATPILAPVRSGRAPGPVAHGGHGAAPLWAACTLIRTGTRSRRKTPGPPSTRVLGVWPRCSCLRGGGQGLMARDDKLVKSRCLGCDPCRILGGDCAAGAPAGDDQITWATAMRAAADGYSVSARIAPKQRPRVRIALGAQRMTWDYARSGAAAEVGFRSAFPRQ